MNGVPGLSYSNGVSNLMIAATQESPAKLLEYLRLANVQINQTDDWGKTALDYAREYGRKANVALLENPEELKPLIPQEYHAFTQRIYRQLRHIKCLDGPLALKVVRINGVLALFLGESHRNDMRKSSSGSVKVEDFLACLFGLTRQPIEFFLETYVQLREGICVAGSLKSPLYHLSCQYHRGTGYDQVHLHDINVRDARDIGLDELLEEQVASLPSVRRKAVRRVVQVQYDRYVKPQEKFPAFWNHYRSLINDMYTLITMLKLSSHQPSLFLFYGGFYHVVQLMEMLKGLGSLIDYEEVASFGLTDISDFTAESVGAVSLPAQSWSHVVDLLQAALA